MIRFLNKEDKERIVEFNKLIHGEGIEKLINNIMFKNPFNSLNNSAYIEEDGKITAAVSLFHQKQRFGKAEIEVGEIGIVGTHPDYRKKGLCTEIMNYWFDYMKQHKIPLCFLFGIADFYQQFDFEYAVPIHFYNYITIHKDKINGIRGKYVVKCIDDSYAEEVLKIYNMSSKDNFCSRVRSLQYFKYRINETSIGGHGWYGIFNEDKLEGYMWLTRNEKELVIREAHIMGEEAARSICKYFYDLIADNEIISNIGMRAPLNNSLAKCLYRFGGTFSCTNEIYSGSWAGMYKIIDLRIALEALKDSFQDRLKNSRFYNITAGYNIVTSIGTVNMHIDNCKIYFSDRKADDTHICIPINILTAVYTGYKDITYYEKEIDFKNSENLELFKTLFPLENPYIWDLEMSDEI